MLYSLSSICTGYLRGVDVYEETMLEVVGDNYKPQKLERPGYMDST